MGRKPNYHLANFGQVESLQVIGQLTQPGHQRCATLVHLSAHRRGIYDHGAATLATSPSGRKRNQPAVESLMKFLR
jgi:hypothetical protein